MFDSEDEDLGGKSFEETKKMPLFKKAEEMLDIAEKIVAILSEMNLRKDKTTKEEMLQNYAKWIMENSSIIPAKITGAEGVGIYDLKMENAAIIRKAARELQTQCTGLKIFGFKETDYLELLRDEIEEFRALFAEWVKTFDPWNYNIDRWGLFNPPGVNYDDKDPDDDIPFDPSDFFDEG